MDSLTPADLTTVAGVAAFTALIFQFILKPVFKLQPDQLDRFGPLIAVLTGVTLAIVGTIVLLPPVTSLAILTAIVTGFIGGLTGIGLFKGVQSLPRIAGG